MGEEDEEFSGPFNPEEIEEQFRIMMAAWDQIAEMSKTQAKKIYQIFEAYLEAGFTTDQALAIIIEYIKAVILP